MGVYIPKYKEHVKGCSPYNCFTKRGDNGELLISIDHRMTSPTNYILKR